MSNTYKRYRTPEQEAADEIFATGVHCHPQTEAMLLASMLSSREIMKEVASGTLDTDSGPKQIGDSFFKDNRNFLAYKAMQQLVELGDLFDDMAIVARARRLSREFYIDKPEDQVTVPWLASLRKTVVDRSLGEIASVLERGDAARKLVEISIAGAHMPADVDPIALRDEMFSKLISIAPNRDSNRVIMGGQSIEAYRRRLWERREKFKAGYYNPMNWPWDSWNAMFDSPPIGKFTSVIMPSGTGKSTFAHSMAAYWATRGYGVAVAMLEDSEGDFWDRQVSRLARVTFRTLRSGAWSDEEENRIKSAEKTIDTFKDKIALIEASGETLPQIIQHVNHLAEKKVVDISIIDYYNAIDVPTRKGYEQDAGRGPKSIVAASNDLKIPYIVFDQLNKTGEYDASKSGEVSGYHQYGSIQVQHSAQIRVTGFSKRAGRDGEFYAGKKIAEPRELSPIINMFAAKNNNGKDGAWSQWVDRPHYTVLDPRANNERTVESE